MSHDTPEIHWAKRFSVSERLLLAPYLCGIPILTSPGF